MVTIHGLHNGAAVPLCFALSSGKTVGQYRQILQCLRERFEHRLAVNGNRSIYANLCQLGTVSYVQNGVKFGIESDAAAKTDKS